MKIKFTGISLLIVLWATSIYAQEVFTATGESERSEQIRALSLTADLLDYGQESKDPYILISAARILIDNPVDIVTSERVVVGDHTKDSPEGIVKAKSTTAIDLDVEVILNKAKEYAAGNEELLSLIEGLSSSAKSRGYAGSGYINGTWRIDAYSSREFKWTFMGKEEAELLFNGDNDTDLDFYIYDSEGELLTSDTGKTDNAHFKWVPPYTKEYTFRVVNHGNVYNDVRILSN